MWATVRLKLDQPAAERHGVDLGSETAAAELPPTAHPRRDPDGDAEALRPGGVCVVARLDGRIDARTLTSAPEPGADGPRRRVGAEVPYGRASITTVRPATMPPVSRPESTTPCPYRTLGDETWSVNVGVVAAPAATATPKGRETEESVTSHCVLFVCICRPKMSTSLEVLTGTGDSKPGARATAAGRRRDVAKQWAWCRTCPPSLTWNCVAGMLGHDERREPRRRCSRPSRRSG